MSEDVLLEVASRKDYRHALKRWAELVVKLGLTSRFGVYAERMPVAGMGIYLGRHDGRSVSDSQRDRLTRAVVLAEADRER